MPDTPSPIPQKPTKDTVNYVLGLLGRQRPTTVRDCTTDEDIEDPTFLQFDTMATQTTQMTNVEDELFTETIESQRETEEVVKQIFDQYLESGETPHLYKKKHTKYLNMALGPLPHMFKSLDASQPWLVYWVCNALAILGENVESEKRELIIKRLLSMQHEDGGFCGGMGQLAHLAPSYAAVLSFALLDDEEAWAKIDRAKMYKWLMSLKRSDGAFVMHLGGEHDTRSAYCALVIASLLDIITPELVEGTAEWLGRCQTFEGGFGGVPYDEAHGGYTFCGTAALMILGKDVLHRVIKLEPLIEWVTARQMKLEGGFSGRSNKLVDGCYSYWVGGAVPILEVLTGSEIMSRASLQNYILTCCQNDQYGGLRDKPPMNADFYHTNYVLLGLSVAQNRFTMVENQNLANKSDIAAYSIQSRPANVTSVVVSEEDVLVPLDPVFALPAGAAEKMKLFFMSQK
ncbi:Protein farnesyltransferase subunit beta [Cyberlindnera fabianii]|uniref:Protein farnesyltransferase subunit beta n=1 Tax=Cyberlindnera fabianii TaxID=36022 RepID=A0A1V2L966_CYBFA|nr:Protein farnesyltransferase subunit beta [Cyberlindnera fabianii]